ncbi:DUF1853 family protein [soil metagenome]
MPPPLLGSESFQAQFHQRWKLLTDRHVRDLAWLLDAPDLLDVHAPQWRGQIASLAGHMTPEVETWLLALNQAPEELRAYLAIQPLTRLGRYAEKLMTFYFRHQNLLFAHNLQVRAGKDSTVGEFDFLLRQNGELLHLEFATKFYLWESSGGGAAPDYFVGPNLADTLGAKMSKILDRQLALASHPAAQVHLPGPVASAQALIKGWLFYEGSNLQSIQQLSGESARAMGVSQAHCRGFWCPLAALELLGGDMFTLLPRLHWLAPARIEAPKALDRRELKNALAAHFECDTMPVMLALLEADGDVGIEVDRGFIVPDDWQVRAKERTHWKDRRI